MTKIPALGASAFDATLNPHSLTSFAANAPEDVGDIFFDFAHDLAAIQNLPVSQDVPREEQLKQRPASLSELFGITGLPQKAAADEPTKEEATDDQN